VLISLFINFKILSFVLLVHTKFLNMNKRADKSTKPIPWNTALKVLAKLEKDEKYEWLLLLAVGFNSGYRLSDLLHLKFSDFAKDKNILDITERKTSKQRPIKIFDEERRIVKLCQKKLKKRDSDYLFTNSRYTANKPISKAAAITRVKQSLTYCRVNGSQLSSHTLRKTFALHFFREFEDRVGSHRALIATSKQLNHADTNTTQLYIGVDELTEIDVFENWDSFETT
jgi:integrase